MAMSLEDQLIHDEDLKTKPYRCPAGKLTIGVGRNLDDNGLSEDECMILLRNDIARCKRELGFYEWYTMQPPGVREALINMCFNMGISRLREFKKMISALQVRKYSTAAIEALDSAWSKQVGDRSKRVAAAIRAGI